jgi:hypothetical protein
MNFNRRLLATGTLVVAIFALAATVSPARAADSKIQLMFVQSSESLKADDKTLRLVNVSPQTIYFTDRPVRMAGHITLPASIRFGRSR